MIDLFHYRVFFWTACKREIKNKYMNSSIGFFWLLLNPVIQLLIYSFVFEKIFQVRFHTETGANFLSFLAVALWPWVAFSEGLNTATNTIDKHKSLLQKVAVPKQLLVLVEVVSPFIVHLIGLIFILLVMRFGFSEPISFQFFPLVLIVYLLQLIFCYGLGLLLSGFQVFLKDIAQLLVPILMIWFYATPIIYPVTLIPEQYRSFFHLNPMTAFVDSYRLLLLSKSLPSLQDGLIMLASSLFFYILGQFVFRRLSSRFEDLY